MKTKKIVFNFLNDYLRNSIITDHDIEPLNKFADYIPLKEIPKQDYLVGILKKV
jgi:hypothetical protein